MIPLFSEFPSFFGVAAPSVFHENANGEVRAFVVLNFAVDFCHPVFHIHFLLFPLHTVLLWLLTACVWPTRRVVFAFAFAFAFAFYGFFYDFTLDPVNDFDDLLLLFRECAFLIVLR